MRVVEQVVRCIQRPQVIGITSCANSNTSGAQVDEQTCRIAALVYNRNDHVAHGPDEVHRMVVARYELRPYLKQG